MVVGLLGGGGATLAVPVFVYALGFGPKEAVASSLAVVCLTSLAGSAEHWREGHVRPRLVLLFGLFSAAGAFLGAKLAALFSGSLQLILLAAVMLAAAFFMFRELRGEGVAEGTGQRSGALLALGAGVGGLTGLVGAGGGFLIVPALVLLAGVPMRQAVGTSVVVVALSSAAGFAGHLGGTPIRWGPLAVLAVVAAFGGLAGAYLQRFVPTAALQAGFAAFLVALAAFILFQNVGSLL